VIVRSKALRSQRQIRYIMKNGKKIYSRFFRVTVIPVRHLEISKVVCVISKKICKKACDRNLLRRRFQHIYLLNRENFKNFHVVIGPKMDIKEISFDIIKKDFEFIMKKIHS